MQQQVTGYLKNEIAEEEDSCDESVLLAADSQFPVHRQRGKSDVVPVEYSDHEQEEDEWDDVRLQPADCRDFDCCWSGRWTGHPSPPDGSAQCSTDVEYRRRAAIRLSSRPRSVSIGPSASHESGHSTLHNPDILTLQRHPAPNS